MVESSISNMNKAVSEAKKCHVGQIYKNNGLEVNLLKSGETFLTRI